jgi:hypothetical protein
VPEISGTSQQSRSWDVPEISGTSQETVQWRGLTTRRTVIGVVGYGVWSAIRRVAV